MLVYVGVGWSGQGLARDSWGEQSPALVGLGWWQTAAWQHWGADPGTLPDTRLAGKDSSDALSGAVSTQMLSLITHYIPAVFCAC